MRIEEGIIVDSQLDDGDPDGYNPEADGLERHDGQGFALIARSIGSIVGVAVGEAKYLAARVSYPFAKLAVELAALDGDERSIAQARDMQRPQRADYR